MGKERKMSFRSVLRSKVEGFWEKRKCCTMAGVWGEDTRNTMS